MYMKTHHQLKVYAFKGQSIQTGGLEAELQGYARFFNYTEYKVIGDIDDTKYKVNQGLVVAGLIAQGVFVTIGTPLLLNAQYPTLYQLANDDHMNALFIWATAVCCFIATVIIFTVDVYFFFIDRTGILMPFTSETIPLYALGVVLITGFIVINFIVAGFLEKKKDFPVPFMLQIVFRRSCNNKSVIQTLAIWFVISFILMITFHLPFIFLAFVASPVQTGSTLLLYATGVFSAISLTTLFFATFQNRNDPLVSKTQKKHLSRTYLLKSLYLTLFICILVFTIFFAICFVRITIYVGDVQSSGIPALIARLAPSVLLGGMGYLGKQVLEKYVPRGKVKMKIEEGEEDEEAAPLTSTSDITSEDDFPAEQNFVMITDTAL